MLHTPYAEHHEATPATTEIPPYLPSTPIVVGAAGASALALLIADMAVAQSFISPQMRGLALVVMLVSAVVGATVWIDRRQVARHQELLDARKPGDCCASAYVDGLARRPFAGPYSHN